MLTPITYLCSDTLFMDAFPELPNISMGSQHEESSVTITRAIACIQHIAESISGIYSQSPDKASQFAFSPFFLVQVESSNKHNPFQHQ